MADSWRFIRNETASAVLNPDGLRVEGIITLYRIVRTDPPAVSAFYTDFWGRGRRRPAGGREKRWPILLHSLSVFDDPVKAARVAQQNRIGDYLATLVLETGHHSDVSVCLSPGRNPDDPAMYHFDLLGPAATLRGLVMRVEPLSAFLP